MKEKNIEKVFKLPEKMHKEGVLKNYAIGGATAAIYYTEPFATQDIDIFFVPPDNGKFILLTSFYDYLLKKGC